MIFNIALLHDRGVVSLTGPDAAKLLQGVITNDMELLATQPALHAGLLGPQGKILFDFFVVKVADGYLLDVARDQAAGLVKRLTMYKLRANVAITDVCETQRVVAVWGDSAVPAGAVTFPDPRLAALGWRHIIRQPDTADAAGNANGNDGSAIAAHGEAAYHAHRIGLGVPEGGKDYAFGDAFPHEALFDQLHGVSFSKGCYVGQEVVSRMEHRGTARKRVVPVVGDNALPASGTEIRAGDQLIGTLGSTAGKRGLALLRLDRAAEMQAAGHALMAGPAAVKIDKQPWATFPLVPVKADQP